MAISFGLGLSGLFGTCSACTPGADVGLGDTPLVALLPCDPAAHGAWVLAAGPAYVASAGAADAAALVSLP